MVRAMTVNSYGTRKFRGAFVASLGVLALALSVTTADAGPGGAHGAFVGAHPPVNAGAFRHFRRHNGVFSYWPGYGDYGYGGDGSAPLAEVPAAPVSNDVHYTYTYDVPWDWAHRYPPMVTPSDRPYVPGCTAEPVTVPGRDGAQRTINVTRCY